MKQRTYRFTCRWCGQRTTGPNSRAAFCLTPRGSATESCSELNRRLWHKDRERTLQRLREEWLRLNPCADCGERDYRRLRLFDGPLKIGLTPNPQRYWDSLAHCTVLCHTCRGRRARAHVTARYGMDEPRPCSNCGVTKPADEFWKQKARGTRKARRQSWCKDCQRARARENGRKRTRERTTTAG